MGKFQFGIIGCSNVAKRRFIPSLLRSSTSKLERIGSRTLEKASEFGKLFNCEKVGSYDDVINDPNVDAIYISTPVTLRDTWYRRAIKNKKHILAEKPAFSNLQDAKEIISLSADAGVRFMEGYMFKYHPQHAFVRKLVSNGNIGTPRIFTAEYTVPLPNPENIRFKKELGGGVMLDAAGYLPMAASIQLHSMPKSVFCKKSIDLKTNIEDVVVMIVEYPENIFGHFTSAYGLQHRSKYSIHGTTGRIEIERAFAVDIDKFTTITLENDETEHYHLEPADQFLLMIDDFTNQVKKSIPHYDYQFEAELLNQHTFMEAARVSQEENRVIYLKELII